jgi:hypothetical protein
METSARIEAQAAELARLKDELAAARAEAEKARAEKAREIERAKAAFEKDLLARSAELEKARTETEKARAEKAAEIERAKATFEKDLRARSAELEKAKAEAEKARSESSAQLQKAHAEHMELERRLTERFNEIAALTRLVAEKEREAGRKDEAVNRMRLAAAKEMGQAVAALLDGRSWRLVPGRIRVRRQMALLKRSALFDADWYRNHYEDIAKEGIDPLLHYVMHGAREGREPNGMLARSGE